MKKSGCYFVVRVWSRGWRGGGTSRPGEEGVSQVGAVIHHSPGGAMADDGVDATLEELWAALSEAEAAAVA
eukprot:2106970-Prymnesium_polylepis.2